MKKCITILIRRERKNHISVIIPKGLKAHIEQQETEVTDDLDIYTMAKVEIIDERKAKNHDTKREDTKSGNL